MGAGKTRVALEHRNLERFGAAAEQVIKSVGSDGGWPMIMGRYATAASELLQTA